MTLHEYKNQTTPRRLTIGSVLIEKTDLTSLKKFAGITYVYIKGYDIQYGTKDGLYGLLKTVDEEGNLVAASVFKLNFEIN